MSRRKTKRIENPERLVALIGSIRTDLLKCSRNKMAEMLNRADRLNNTEDNGEQCVQRFSTEIVKNLENGTSLIQYHHVSTYGNLLRIPTGVLLLFSSFSRTKGVNDERFAEFSYILAELSKIRQSALSDGRALNRVDLIQLSHFVQNIRPENLSPEAKLRPKNETSGTGDGREP